MDAISSVLNEPQHDEVYEKAFKHGKDVGKSIGKDITEQRFTLLLYGQGYIDTEVSNLLKLSIERVRYILHDHGYL
jgi:hypothetical protein